MDMNKSKKCSYISFFKFGFNTITPVYKRNAQNSVTFQYSKSFNDLGRRENSDGTNFLILKREREIISFFSSIFLLVFYL